MDKETANKVLDWMKDTIRDGWVTDRLTGEINITLLAEMAVCEFDKAGVYDDDDWFELQDLAYEAAENP